MSHTQPNDFFAYHHHELHAEEVSLKQIAQEFETPCYVYSANALTQNYLNYTNALKNQKVLICYAVKANSNLAILKHFSSLGSGFDIVSTGELKRVIAAGGDVNKVVFSGVAKSKEDIKFALTQGVLCFNVESENELHRIQEIAQSLNQFAKISLRVNPNVDAKTHPYISTGLKENKFGIGYEHALDVYRQAKKMSHIDIVGIDCHIGSQLTDSSPYLDALDKILDLVSELANDEIKLKHLDLGGGVGITYTDEVPPNLVDLYTQIRERMINRGFGDLTLILEPGRSLVGNAGILLTKVEFIKDNGHKNFALVDAAMNDLMRPAFYEAYHQIHEVTQGKQNAKIYDVVGPICETGDWLGKERSLAIEENDLLAILSAGAYGMTMASNYNTRPRAAEVLVDGKTVTLIRRRETVEQLIANELDLI